MGPDAGSDGAGEESVDGTPEEWEDGEERDGEGSGWEGKMLRQVMLSAAAHRRPTQVLQVPLSTFACNPCFVAVASKLACAQGS